MRSSVDMPSRPRRGGFTLIELLIVIAILAVLATVVVFALNPAEYYRNAKDAVRINDLAAVHGALMSVQATARDLWMGTSTVLYVSVPDPTATTSAGTNCAGVGLALSALPSGWMYRCPHPSYSRNVDGTGWIPIDFTALSFSPISLLPIDPANDVSTHLYYTYAASTTSRKWHLTAVFQSEKHAPKQADDGGYDPATYELGTDLTLSPFAHGMIGYWALDEGTGSIARDRSGLGNDGTLVNSPAWAAACPEGGCLDFTVAAANYVNIGTFTAVDGIPKATLMVWMKRKVANDVVLIGKQFAGSPTFAIENWNDGKIYYGVAETTYAGATIDESTHDWFHYALSFDGTQSGNSGRLRVYQNGARETASFTGTIPANTPTTAGNFRVGLIGSNYSNGLVDEVRVYARALTDAQIQAAYDAEQ